MCIAVTRHNYICWSHLSSSSSCFYMYLVGGWETKVRGQLVVSCRYLSVKRQNKPQTTAGMWLTAGKKPMQEQRGQGRHKKSPKAHRNKFISVQWRNSLHTLISQKLYYNILHRATSHVGVIFQIEKKNCENRDCVPVFFQLLSSCTTSSLTAHTHTQFELSVCLTVHINSNRLV